jgi:hypothetical protein
MMTVSLRNDGRHISFSDRRLIVTGIYNTKPVVCIFDVEFAEHYFKKQSSVKATSSAANVSFTNETILMINVRVKGHLACDVFSVTAWSFCTLFGWKHSQRQKTIAPQIPEYA